MGYGWKGVVTEAGGSLQAASTEMASRYRQQRQGRIAQAQLNHWIGFIDEMVEELEQMNLREQRRVPTSFRARLDRLTARLPAVCQHRLASRASPTRLMDELWRIQAELLSLKHVETRSALEEADREIEAHWNHLGDDG